MNSRETNHGVFFLLAGTRARLTKTLTLTCWSQINGPSTSSLSYCAALRVRQTLSIASQRWGGYLLSDVYRRQLITANDPHDDESSGPAYQSPYDSLEALSGAT